MATDLPVTAAFAASANPFQLHAQAAAAAGVSPWPASFCQVGGSWVYRVDLALSANQATAVAAAIAAHVPDPAYGRPASELRLDDLGAKASPTAAEVAEAVRLLIARRR